jgi:hypothetical protein
MQLIELEDLCWNKYLINCLFSRFDLAAAAICGPIALKPQALRLAIIMEDQPPEEQPKKGQFRGKPKRGRSLSRYRSKGNKKSTHRPSPDTLPPSPRPQERDHDVPEHRQIAARLHSKGRQRKIPNKELSSALKRANKEIEDQQLLLESETKNIWAILAVHPLSSGLWFM